MKLSEAPTAGPITPDPDGPDRPYWDGLRRGELRIPRCRDCSRHVWAPQRICPGCRGAAFDWPVVAPTATVFSWTRTWHPFLPELADHVPYTVVLARLDEVPSVRLLGMLVDDESTLRIGAALHGVIQPAGPLTHDTPVLRWRLSA
ncbi:Zn-ribbon domain-containing OB-fold protein [Streptomyces sp. NWU49]|uniref:Zn-ribbon domain-containing OB-fold protein n=1 Tax=Streptomyces sp. NWU49 TaxID=2201153 RepID=UPI001C62F48F|nr:OB-fold domain-containing protein [Streptomyces sp. NWU49]